MALQISSLPEASGSITPNTRSQGSPEGPRNVTATNSPGPPMQEVWGPLWGPLAWMLLCPIKKQSAELDEVSQPSFEGYLPNQKTKIWGHMRNISEKLISHTETCRWYETLHKRYWVSLQHWHWYRGLHWSPPGRLSQEQETKVASTKSHSGSMSAVSRGAQDHPLESTWIIWIKQYFSLSNSCLILASLQCEGTSSWQKILCLCPTLYR